jgi:hypothetical protein
MSTANQHIDAGSQFWVENDGRASNETSYDMTMEAAGPAGSAHRRAACAARPRSQLHPRAERRGRLAPNYEAGHAIIALVCGVSVGSAAIIETEGTAGTSISGKVRHGDMSPLLGAVITMAGPLAELRGIGSLDADCADIVEDHRHEVSALLLELIMREGAKAGAPEVWEEICMDYLNEHWDGIERVAAALIEKKSLTGDEIEALYHGARVG